MEKKRKKILYVQYTNPAAFPPLENSAWVLAESGWQVNFIGTEALGVENIKFPFHTNIKIDLIPFCYPGLRQKLHFIRYNLKCFKAIVLGRYSYLYISDLFSCPLGWIAASCLGVKVFYHEHDTPEAPQTKFTQFLHLARKKLAVKAKLCIFPQIERARLFSNKFSNSKIQICHNMPLKERAIFNKSLSSHDEFRLWYHGSLVPTLLPFTVLEALALLPNSVTLHFAGYEIVGFPNFVEQFIAKAKSIGVESRVVYEGALSRGPLYDKARLCDLGLSLFARIFREPMVGASNKPFDYMACGLPLLINDSSEWVDFFENRGVAKSCNPESSESIAKTIQELRNAPDKIRIMKDLGLKKITSEWNYESQFAPVLKVLET